MNATGVELVLQRGRERQRETAHVCIANEERELLSLQLLELFLLPYIILKTEWFDLCRFDVKLSIPLHDKKGEQFWSCMRME